MDQFRERKRAEAHVSPALGTPAAGQVNAHARATAAVVATVAATAQVKVHWRKRGLTETRAQSSQVGNHCSISLKSLSRVYIEISAKGKGQRGHRSHKMVHGKDRSNHKIVNFNLEKQITADFT